jgi:hypothetical protein
MITYNFTTDWFTKYQLYVEQIVHFLKPKRILEIGSFEGRSTVFMLEKSSEFNEVEIICVDTWTGGSEHISIDFTSVESRFDDNVTIGLRNCRNSSTITKLKGTSRYQLPKLMSSEQKFDLVYLDGSHEPPDVLFDLVCSFQMLNKGGVLIADDYKWSPLPRGKEDLLLMPKMSIDAFVNCNIRYIDLIEFPINQLYLRKR